MFSVQQKTWQIADFGLTAEGTSKRANTTHYARGTVSYRAPELMSEKSTYTNKVDIFALGCILFELISDGKRAFVDDLAVRGYQLSPKLIEIPLTVEYQQTRNLLTRTINRMLSVDATKRPSARQLHTRFARYRRLALGAICMENKNYALAVVAYEAATRRNDNDGPAWKALGDSYRAINNLKGAWQAYNKALQLGFDAPIILSSLKEIFLATEGIHMESDLLKATGTEACLYRQHRSAIFSLQKVIDESHNNLFLPDRLGQVYCTTGELDRAMKTYQHALNRSTRARSDSLFYLPNEDSKVKGRTMKMKSKIKRILLAVFRQ